MGLFKELFFERKSDVLNIDKISSIYDQLLNVPDDKRDLTYDSDERVLFFDLSDVGIEVKPDITIQYKLTENTEDDATAEIVSYDGYDEVDIRFYPRKNKYHHVLMTMGVQSNKLIDYFFDNIGFFIPRDLFVHEFTHYLDKGLLKGRSSGYGEHSEKYFNDFNEIQAYLVQYFDNYVDMIRNGDYQSFDEFRNDFIEDIEYIWKYLSDENKKRVNKRIYSFWGEYSY